MQAHISRADFKDLDRAARDLRNKMRACRDVESCEVEVVPDDMRIDLTAHMKNGSVRKRSFHRKTVDNGV